MNDGVLIADSVSSRDGKLVFEFRFEVLLSTDESIGTTFVLRLIDDIKD